MSYAKIIQSPFASQRAYAGLGALGNIPSKECAAAIVSKRLYDEASNWEIEEGSATEQEWLRRGHSWENHYKNVWKICKAEKASSGSIKGAKPPPPPHVWVDAIAPGMYPGTGPIADELRLKGTVGGAPPRGFANAAQSLQFIRCMNEKLPNGLPRQTKEERTAAISGLRFHCALSAGLDASSSQAPAADAVVALLRPGVKINAAVLSRVKKSTAPTVPLLRLPSGVIKPVTEVEPAVAANSVPATASPSTEAAAADKDEKALFGLPPSTILMGGMAVAAVMVTAFVLSAQRTP